MDNKRKRLTQACELCRRKKVANASFYCSAAKVIHLSLRNRLDAMVANQRVAIALV